VASNAIPTSTPGEPYPGQRLGLPAAGRGSLATWQGRVTALVVDWVASMLVASGLFGMGVINGDGWRVWMVMVVFFAESTVLAAVAGGSFGQLVTKIGIARLDGQPLGFVRAALRAALVCLVLPAVVVGQDRRGLHDTVVGTVVIKRR
jgi:uncharacterized RDD family membrane protein YckC